MSTASAVTQPAQIRTTRRSPAYWRVTIDNPPINVMGPQMVREFQGVINALEADEHVRVVVVQQMETYLSPKKHTMTEGKT
jgi:enoyl-CoA hydratase/carnithine racemase